MLSRLHATMPRLGQPLGPTLSNCSYSRQILVNRLKQHLFNNTPIRKSGHRAMDIEPSSYEWRKLKDTAHFWFLIFTIPLSVFATIVNIRSNPELIEIPEGYEPREWEYYKHPFTRFLARYCFRPMEFDQELQMAAYDSVSQTDIIIKIEKACDRVMRFHNDSRNMYFHPYHGEYARIGRDYGTFSTWAVSTVEGHYLDSAYDPKQQVVPIEGYSPEDGDLFR